MIRQLRYIIIVFILNIVLVGDVLSQSYGKPSVLSTGKWYTVSISEDGVYKLTYNDFLTLGASQEEIDLDNLSIFSNTGQPLDIVVKNNLYDDLQENAIYVNKQQRYVLFYGKATTQIIYDTVLQRFDFKLHPYATSTKYFITFDSSIGEKKRITNIINNNTIVDTTLSTAKDFSYHKRELYNLNNSGTNWVGEKFLSTQTDLQVPFVLTNCRTDIASTIKYSIVKQTNSQDRFLFSVPVKEDDVLKNDTTVVTSNATTRVLLNSPSFSINIHYQPSNQSSQAWLDDIVINYTKQLTFSNSALQFYSTLKTNNNIRYDVSGLRTNNYMVWDVSNPIEVKSIGETVLEEGVLSFNVLADTLRNIIVLSGSSFASPVLEDSLVNQNLHGIDSSELIIVCYEPLINQAERLAQIHRDYDNIKVSVVPLQQVFNEFSSGTRDFFAIRQFIRYIYKKTNGLYPQNVLLFGDGTFDNKNILQLNNNFIPTYQEDVYPTSDGITSDDLLAQIGDNSTGSLIDSLYVGIGRFPVADTVSSKVLVDKCERYITKSDLRKGLRGDWRNTVMLTCDDADEKWELYQFYANAENIYGQIDATNPYLNIYKVYEDAYKEYTSASGASYPDASNAIDARMNQGCLLFNYLGHGSPDHLSSERLITITNISSWENYDKLCLMITSTCEFNRFDLADKQAAGEYILTSEKGAGIGLIAAARKIASKDPINRALHKYAVERLSNGKTRTFGQVMKEAKNYTLSHNDLDRMERSITLIGDPALRLSVPQYNIVTTQINNTSYDSLSGTMNSLDTIRALSTVRIKGEIRDFNNQKINTFNGNIQVSLYDKKSIHYTLNNAGIVLDSGSASRAFELQTSLLYKGDTIVKDGEFSITFVVPKDISYNYGLGKLSYYAQNDTIDATGYSRDFILGGIDSSASQIAETRPLLSLYINDTNFVSGGITDENPSLYAIVIDSIPINIVGTGLGHDIVARLDNAANTFILNDYYTQNEEHPEIGYITYPFSNLSEGEHTLTLRIWNIYNYSTQQTIKFKVVNSATNEYSAINYPNPFKESTTFELRYNQPNNLTKVILQIHNQSGQLISQIDCSDKIGTYNVGPIFWDGTNFRGSKVDNGIYFYTFVITTNDSTKKLRTNKLVKIK